MMTAHLCGLNKMGYVNGSIKALEEESVECAKWENINGVVMSVWACTHFLHMRLFN